MLSTVAGRTTSPSSLDARSRNPNSLILSNPLAAHCVEEMRSLHIERQHDAAAQRWQRLGRRDACGDVMPAGAGINEGLIAQRLHEIESRCRGSGSAPCTRDY